MVVELDASTLELPIEEDAMRVLEKLWWWCPPAELLNATVVLVLVAEVVCALYDVELSLELEL